MSMFVEICNKSILESWDIKSLYRSEINNCDNNIRYKIKIKKHKSLKESYTKEDRERDRKIFYRTTHLKFSTKITNLQLHGLLQAEWTRDNIHVVEIHSLLLSESNHNAFQRSVCKTFHWFYSSKCSFRLWFDCFQESFHYFHYRCKRRVRIIVCTGEPKTFRSSRMGKTQGNIH